MSLELLKATSDQFRCLNPLSASQKSRTVSLYWAPLLRTKPNLACPKVKCENSGSSYPEMAGNQGSRPFQGTSIQGASKSTDTNHGLWYKGHGKSWEHQTPQECLVCTQRIVYLLKLEQTFRIIKHNNQPTNPCLQVSHPHDFKSLQK